MIIPNKERFASTSFVKFQVMKTMPSSTNGDQLWKYTHLWHWPYTYRPYHRECTSSGNRGNILCFVTDWWWPWWQLIYLPVSRLCGYPVLVDKKAERLWHSLQPRGRAARFLINCWGLEIDSSFIHMGEAIYICTIAHNLICTLKWGREPRFLIVVTLRSVVNAYTWSMAKHWRKGFF